MKTNYLIKLCYALLMLFQSHLAHGQTECFRIISVDTELNLISISNLTSEAQDLSNYRLCSLFSYTNSGIGANTTAIFGDIANIPAGNFVIVEWTVDDVAADVALYEPIGDFSDPSAMVDFMQYGSAGNGRESEAVAAGLWTAGDFIPGVGPLVWVGNCMDHSSDNWFFPPVGTQTIGDIEIAINQDFGDDNVVVQFSKPLNEAIGIELFDLNGKLISAQHISETSGTQFNVQMNGSSGIYLIKLSIGEDLIKTFKVVH